MYTHDYIFYTTDESFDYPTGYGYATENVIGEHGVSVTFDGNKVISWEGLGYFNDVDDIEKIEDFYTYIQECAKDYGTAELDELLDCIKETMEQVA